MAGIVDARVDESTQYVRGSETSRFVETSGNGNISFIDTKEDLLNVKIANYMSKQKKYKCLAMSKGISEN